jgi:hypothetical protein
LAPDLDNTSVGKQKNTGGGDAVGLDSVFFEGMKNGENTD